MAAQILWIIASSIYILLATLHLLYTFFTNKFDARDKNTMELMKQTHPLLTNKLTMWSAWIGFNGSHSAGGIFLGAVNIILAIFYFDFLSAALSLLILTDITSLFFLFLGVKYWFNTPLRGIVIATICYIAATIIILV